MHININQKLFLMILVFFLLPLTMFIATIIIVSQQRDDGLIINLAGRQRMLSQKMTKEALTNLHLARMKRPEQETTLVDLRRTMTLFDRTSNALLRSGRAPLTADPEGAFVTLSAVRGEALVRMRKADELWKSLKAAIERANAEQTEESIQAVLRLNPMLLAETDAVTVLLQQQAERRVNILYYVQIVCILLGVAIVALFVFLNNRSIVRPIRQTVDFARRIAEGDLSRHLDIRQKDEIGTLADTFNHMIQTLSGMIGDINRNVMTLNEAATEMNTISRQMTAVSDKTAEKSNTVSAAAEETNSGMNSIAAAMEEASTNLDTVAAATEEMSTNIADITENVGQASGNTKNAVEQARKASEQVSKLGQAAEEIGEVSETITAISDKTALLALNATIEAARAGDAGKGFAVVANEIKELAQQTAQATGSIAGKLQEIQNLTGATVNVIETITQVIEQVNVTVFGINESVEHQSLATREIAENIAQASSGVKEINTNIAQTNTATAQVAQEITEVNEGAEQMSNSSAQLQQTAVRLNELSENLKQLVAQFKTA
jgi:methyl-accepting chemotaxis protein